MALAHRLQMRQGQSLVMTPQLQQAIKLLQFSNVELAEFVESEIEKNPLLERGEAEGAPDQPESTEKESEAREDLNMAEGSSIADARENLDASNEDAYEADSPSEQAPDMSSGPTGSVDWSKTGSGGSGGEDFDFEAMATEEKTLKRHLEEQLMMAGLNGVDHFIASRFIDEVDVGGYMRTPLEEVATALGADLGDVERVLGVCQGFEPTGVMARDLQECLILQLKEKNRFDPAMGAMIENLELVAKHDMKRLADVCGVDKADLMDMLGELRELNPKPGSAFADDAAAAVVPDVFVRELPNGMFAVELNTDTLPKVLLDKSYYAEVSGLSKSENEKTFVAECHANANWLIKSLDQRARTILKVSREIVRQQDAFFVRGVQALRPLNLKTVADAVDMHESTVSRVTSNKFMSTPRGVFELKYFFSAAIPATSGGEAHSAEAVRHRIKSLIDAEEAGAVLSDDQIVERLRAFGVDIARRTVAKYRESLKIPSSVERRRKLAQSA